MIDITESFFNFTNLPVVRKTARLLLGAIEFNKDFCININGLKLYSNTPDRILAAMMWKLSGLEENEIRFMRKYLTRDTVILDVGANIGFFSLTAASIQPNLSKIYAFEPDPNNFRLLKKNIQQNRFSNIAPVRSAVSDKCGTGRLYISKEHRGDHRIFDSGDGRRASAVNIVSIDEYFREKNKVDLIKLDVQGAEFRALQGMKKTILQNPQVVLIIEFSPFLLRQCGDQPEEFLDYIENLGFYLRVIDNKTEQARIVTKKDLLLHCRGTRFENLFLMKV